MSVRRLEHLFAPSCVAVIGASEREGSIAAAVTEGVFGGFEGEVSGVNPNRRRVFGKKLVKRVKDLPFVPDLAVITSPPDSVVEQAEALAQHGTKTALIITDAKRGALPAGEVRRRLYRIARAHDMRIVGPNCLGLAVPHLGLHATMSRFEAKRGHIAFVGQSATAAGPLVDWAQPRGLGFSHVASLGDMVDVDYADVLYYLAADPRTRCIVLYAERLPNARKFMSAARYAARAKPVVVVKAGALAGFEDDRGHMPGGADRDLVYDAVFRRAGLLRARTLDELFYMVEALAARLPADTTPARGDRLAVLANGESMGMLALDPLLEAGFAPATLSTQTVERLAKILPPGRPRRNPVDILPDAGAERYREAMAALLDDRGIDAILALAGPTGVASGVETAEAVADAVSQARRQPGRIRPWVITSWPGGADAASAREVFTDAHIATFDTPSAAVAAFAILCRHRSAMAALTETPPSIPETFSVDRAAARAVIEPVMASGDGHLGTEQSSRVLAAYGLAPKEPAGPGIAFRLSLSLDAEFGPVLVLGLGGAMGQHIDRGTVGLPPLSLPLAKDVILAGALTGKLFAEEDDGTHLEGIEPLALLLAQVSQLIVDMPEIVRLEMNEIVLEDGLVYPGPAQIWLAPMREGRDAEMRRLTIRPYPVELEKEIAGRDGKPYHLRPIRPEDEPRLRDLFERLSPEDVRMRFFRPLKRMTHDFAARLTQIDYDRQMAFVLSEPGRPGEAVLRGVVRLVLDPNEETGEYAVTVESTLHGTGLGRLLMEHIIDYARDTGLASIFGLVLRENEAMLRLCTKLGFEQEHEPGEPGIVRVVLRF